MGEREGDLDSLLPQSTATLDSMSLVWGGQREGGGGWQEEVHSRPQGHEGERTEGRAGDGGQAKGRSW